MSRERCATETCVGSAGASIRWCSGCGVFHISLGFVQISLTFDQFTHLHSLINEAMQRVVKQQRESPETVEENASLKPRFH
jgi:hypothetical protein